MVRLSRSASHGDEQSQKDERRERQDDRREEQYEDREASDRIERQPARR